MWEVLTNLTLDRPIAVALVLIPMLLNMYILFYLNLRILPDDTSTTFAYFIRANLIWQLRDCMCRLAATAETANLWDNVLSSGYIASPALGLLFALQYAGYQKFARKIPVIFLIFLPPLFFQSTYGNDIKSITYHFSPFWGWFYNFNQTYYGPAIAIWIILCSGLSIILIAQFAWKSRKIRILFKQSMLLIIGRGIVLLQNLGTVLVLTLGIYTQTFPVSSSLMGVLSVATIIALHRYRLFRVPEPEETPQFVEYPAAAKLKILPEFRIIEANDFAQYIFNIKPNEKNHIPAKSILNEDPDNLHEFAVALGDCITGKLVENKEISVLFKGKGPATVLLSATPIYKDDRLEAIELVMRNPE